MKHTLPGQLDLPETPERPAELAKQLARAPMMAPKPQLPCDVGLFSDDASQLDLIEMLMEPDHD
jgi:hypothetical protein